MSILARVLRARQRTMRLAEPLSPEDLVVQSMPDASPAKWHLAHTTWFFERFVLRPLGVPPVRAEYDYLFNSYYDAVGPRHPRPARGLLTRPSADEVFAYRRAIDGRLADLEGSPKLAEPDLERALELGMHHEEQHQELLLTDIKHLFAQSPLLPAYAPAEGDAAASASAAASPLAWHAHGGGIVEIGHGGPGFAFDNEAPRHKVYLAPFELASRLVTEAEYLDFVRDGGYRRSTLWLSEGWAWVQANARRAPLYWLDGDDGGDDAPPRVFTLHGARPHAPAAPVCHLTYYEADAFARWSGARLPTEAEWEASASSWGPTAPLMRSAHEPPPLPMPSARSAFALRANADECLHPGDAWQWTSSAYCPYPGFRPLAGAFGEYNGKFMVSQMVLRGGSCATPPGHARVTYRNFFPPGAAWQFSGVRLARDA